MSTSTPHDREHRRQRSQQHSWQYVAADGNYGDARDLRFLPTPVQITGDGIDAVDVDPGFASAFDPESESAVTGWAATHGVHQVHVLVCIDDKDTHITVHPDEDDALEAVRVNYVTAQDGVVSDEELLDFCHRQGLLVYLQRTPIPFLT